jgi:hypothetical protein
LVLDTTQLKYSKLQFTPAEPKQDMKDQNTKQTLSQNKGRIYSNQESVLHVKNIRKLKILNLLDFVAGIF